MEGKRQTENIQCYKGCKGCGNGIDASLESVVGAKTNTKNKVNRGSYQLIRIYPTL